MRYYGNKTKLLPFIEKAVKSTSINGSSCFADLFSGTSAVGRYFKQRGHTVIANDNLEFAYVLAKTYIELNEVPRFTKLCEALGLSAGVPTLFDYLNHYDRWQPGFITENYAPQGGRQYFTDANALRIDTFRTLFEDWRQTAMITQAESYYLLTALLQAVNLVSNVSGTYAAYLKTWDRRALKPLVLQPFEIIPNCQRNSAYKRDANELVKEIAPDLIYLDPPYNSRQYAANYFILELIAEGWFGPQPPVIYGATGMRAYHAQKSLYASKSTARTALEELLTHAAKARYIILSYNNEGLIPLSELEKLLRHIGEVTVFQESHKRYRSINQTIEDAQLTFEHVFVVTPSPPAPKKKLVNKTNSLDGKEWLQNSISIWRELGKNEEERKLKHPAIFTLKLAGKLIDTFCPPQPSLILDCFAGSGTTLLAALQKGHDAVGCDLNADFKTLFLKRAINSYGLETEGLAEKYRVQDARTLTAHVAADSVDLCLTSPPYWDILNRRRTADYKENINYSESDEDLGNISDYQEFVAALQEVFREVHTVLKPKAYFIVNVMDLRKKDKFFPLHIDAARIAQECGFSFEDIVIWDRQAEYNNMRPLGYPFKFIVNKVHEYLLLFRKQPHGQK